MGPPPGEPEVVSLQVPVSETRGVEPREEPSEVFRGGEGKGAGPGEVVERGGGTPPFVQGGGEDPGSPPSRGDQGEGPRGGQPPEFEIVGGQPEGLGSSPFPELSETEPGANDRSPPARSDPFPPFEDLEDRRRVRRKARVPAEDRSPDPAERARIPQGARPALLPVRAEEGRKAGRGRGEGERAEKGLALGLVLGPGPGQTESEKVVPGRPDRAVPEADFAEVQKAPTPFLPPVELARVEIPVREPAGVEGGEETPGLFEDARILEAGQGRSGPEILEEKPEHPVGVSKFGSGEQPRDPATPGPGLEDPLRLLAGSEQMTPGPSPEEFGDHASGRPRKAQDAAEGSVVEDLESGGERAAFLEER